MGPEPNTLPKVQTAPNLLGPIQTALGQIAELLGSDSALREHFSSGAFTRCGVINPAQLLVNDLLNFGQSAAGGARSLRDDFGVVTPEAVRPLTAVSPSAITQARQKIKPSVWLQINRIVLEAFKECPGLRTFKGRRVVAADGTIVWSNSLISKSFEVNLKPDQKARLAIRKAKKGAYYEQLQMLMLYDPLNQIHLGHAVELQIVSERELLLHLLDHLEPGQLALLDRGYPAAWLFVELQRRGLEYLSRLRHDHSIDVEAFVASGESDKWLELPIVAASKNKLKELGIPMPESRSVRVRVVRIRDDEGKDQLFVTSLNEAEASATELTELYNRRWEIEKEICTFKQPLVLEGWRGFSEQGIHYDLGAKAVAYNLARLLSWPVSQEFSGMKLSGSGFKKVVCTTRALGELKPTLLPILRTIVGGRPQELSPAQLLQRFQNEVRHKASVIDPKRKRPLGKNRHKPDRRVLSQRKAA